jgi:excisionase family DNA binding protein
LDTPQQVEDELLPPAAVAKRFGVDPRTLRGWAAAGKINARRTLGGHRRYRASEVSALLAATEAATS